MALRDVFRFVEVRLVFFGAGVYVFLLSLVGFYWSFMRLYWSVTVGLGFRALGQKGLGLRSCLEEAL